MARARTMAAMTGLGVATSFACGQRVSPAPAPATPPPRSIQQTSWLQGATLTRVEPLASDVDPLSTSLRAYPVDLRMPMGFKEIFRINGSGVQAERLGFATAGGQDLLARVDGAVTAVFPQSVYREGKNGTIPQIPPGTIFFIGGLPRDPFEGQEDPVSSPARVESRLDSRAATVLPAPGVQRSTPAPEPLLKTSGNEDDTGKEPKDAAVESGPSVMTDESLRASSVRLLLMRAAKSADAKPEPQRRDENKTDRTGGE